MIVGIFLVGLLSLHAQIQGGPFLLPPGTLGLCAIWLHNIRHVSTYTWTNNQRNLLTSHAFVQFTSNHRLKSKLPISFSVHYNFLTDILNILCTFTLKKCLRWRMYRKKLLHTYIFYDQSLFSNMPSFNSPAIIESNLSCAHHIFCSLQLFNRYSYFTFIPILIKLSTRLL